MFDKSIPHILLTPLACSTAVHTIQGMSNFKLYYPLLRLFKSAQCQHFVYIQLYLVFCLICIVEAMSLLQTVAMALDMEK
ncbi:hypothetical protein GDO78_010454 [Eleutherodactylus coqui]|uniref:Uncharacterized protein n=1 Tax=Eleutherodactylus coqui TaxID=57060 RepID=A0A8J6F5Q2_ELECQ|nr:hypothetical protein GDO78_010454 [Eleutherodactylus coqui]